MIAITRKVHFNRGRSGRKRMARGAEPSRPVGRIPRISKLMALAIRFDGDVYDMSELARLAHVTQPRVTQIMNLLHLAPDIQEELLFLPEVTEGRDPIHERMLRPLTTILEWNEQRRRWRGLRDSALQSSSESGKTSSSGMVSSTSSVCIDGIPQ